MNYQSTRNRCWTVSSTRAVLEGIAPDGGLYISRDLLQADFDWRSLLEEDTFTMSRRILSALLPDFDDMGELVQRGYAGKFESDELTPLVKVGDRYVLELFRGPTSAFKDVALSILPQLITAARRSEGVSGDTVILTATSGDTGKAALEGFRDVPGTRILVFYPEEGVSRIQKAQMTTQQGSNVTVCAIRGNFDDAQTAVKRIFADPAIAAEAAAHGVTLSSANSINTGRLVPQVAYYALAGARLGCEFDVVVPSGNFGNILAAWYAKRVGAPIRRLVVASNVNDVLARFVKTGVYEPGPDFTVTNSPSMDIRISSNVERLLWELNFEGDAAAACAATARLMSDLKEKGRYELSAVAKARLLAEFGGGVATPEETESEMRRLRDEDGYLVDPHTAVGSFVARRLGYPRDGVPCIVAATATPYKFPETCRRAYGEDVLVDPPQSVAGLERLPVAQKRICDVGEMDAVVRELIEGRVA